MKISDKIIAASIKIHKTLGPGLLESVYTRCLKFELEKIDLQCSTEVIIPVTYETMHFESGFRADLIVDNKVIVEVKSVDKPAAAHKAQTLTYLKLSKLPLAMLINFGEPLLKDGIYRYANGNEANDL